MGNIEKIVHEKKYLLPMLWAVQEEFGYLSEENLKKLSIAANIPFAKVYGVATFYSSFSIEKQGKNIVEVCNSPSCYLNDSIDAIKEIQSRLKIKSGETTKDKKYTLRIGSCIGCCDKAPAMRINGKLYGNLTKNKVGKILKCRY